MFFMLSPLLIGAPIFEFQVVVPCFVPFFQNFKESTIRLRGALLFFSKFE